MIAMSEPTDAKAANVAPNRDADLSRSRPGSAYSGQIAVAVSLFVLALLTSVHLIEADRGWRGENALLVLAVSMVSAWFCPAQFAFTLPLITYTIWTVVDMRNEPTGWAYPFGCAVRFSLSILLVSWIARIRQELDQARQFARVDSLTGIANRLSILESLEAELSRVRRFGRTFSIAVIDCDGFKKINDVRGHLVGDRCLQRIASVLHNHIRAYDRVGRLGGDEFVVILSEANPEDVKGIIQRMRSELHTDLNHDYPSLSFSIGVASVQQTGHRASPPLDWCECLQAADDAMYAAKRNGKNRTEYTALNIGI